MRTILRRWDGNGIGSRWWRRPDRGRERAADRHAGHGRRFRDHDVRLAVTRPATDQAREKPFGSALSPDGKYLASATTAPDQSLSLVEVATGKVLQSLPYASPQSLFIGLAWSPDGSKLYAAAGGNDKIRVYSTRRSADRGRSDHAAKGSFPSGLAVSSDGSKLFVADNGSGRCPPSTLRAARCFGTVATGPTRSPSASPATDVRVRVDWGTNTVSAVDTTTLTVRKTLTVGSHRPRSSATRHGRAAVAVTDADSDRYQPGDRCDHADDRPGAVPERAVGSSPQASPSPRTAGRCTSPTLGTTMSRSWTCAPWLPTV